MDSTASPGIGTALLILFNLLYFVLTLSVASLLIERVWIGRTRWLILPVVGSSLILFSFFPVLILRILDSVIGPFSLSNLLTITGFGILAGMAMSSL